MSKDHENSKTLIGIENLVIHIGLTFFCTNGESLKDITSSLFTSYFDIVFLYTSVWVVESSPVSFKSMFLSLVINVFSCFFYAIEHMSRDWR